MGYAGGTIPNPTYHNLGNHTETVRVYYDPTRITYEELLDVYWNSRDYTQQYTTQYKSIIFYHNDEQRETAEQYVRELEASGKWANPIVTEVTPLDLFYVAEDYHQQYYRNNSRQPYCRAVIAPKVAKFQKHYLIKLKI